MKTFEEWCQDREIVLNELSPKFLAMAYKIWGEDCFVEGQRYEAENAALRKKLEKAITPEFKIYEDVYFIDYVDEKGYSDHTTGKPKIREAFITCVSQVMQTEFLYRLQPKDLPQEILNDSTIHEEWWDGQHYYAKEIFKTFEAALARLAELNGEKENEKH